MTDKDENEKPEKPWVVRDVPEETRRDVKAYAAKQGVSMAEALEELVRRALEVQRGLAPTGELPKELPAPKSGGYSVHKQHRDAASPIAEDSLLTEEDVRRVVEVLLSIEKQLEQRLALAFIDTGIEAMAEQFVEAAEKRGQFKEVDERMDQVIANFNEPIMQVGLPPMTFDQVLQRAREHKKRHEGK